MVPPATGLRHLVFPVLCWTLFSPTRRGWWGIVRVKGSIGCNDHEMVEFKILRAARKAHSRLTTLGFRRADFDLFRDLLGRVP